MRKLLIQILTLLLMMINPAWNLLAQTVPFTLTGTSPVAFNFDSSGNLSSVGTLGTGFSLTGAGTRMFWYPGKAAFRAGNVSGTEWNDTNIGEGSVAFGEGTIASGYNSAAFGYGTFADEYGAAFGYSTYAGGYSAAFGMLTTASWQDAAFGNHTTAAGGESVAMGYGTFAYGTMSLAGGNQSNADGESSIAFGEYVNANSLESLVIGQYNIGGGSTWTWVATDPAFEIGNGQIPDYITTFDPTYSDAFVVYKNGNAAFQGSVRVAPGGDLSMGGFTAGTHP